MISVGVYSSAARVLLPRLKQFQAGRNVPYASQTRTTAVNLIEGRYHEVVDFLDQLSYGSGSTPGTLELYADWRKKIDETGKKWGDDRLRRW